MSLIHRRGFMKTMLASAAGSPFVDSLRARAIMATEQEPTRSSAVLEHGDQQLRISSAGGSLAFQNFVRVSSEWRPATLPDVPLVTGPSFPLRASSVGRKDAAVVCTGSAMATGLDGNAVVYDWSSEITAPSFRFRTTLQLPHAVRLKQASEVEPQIIVWLNSNSTLMEGQSGSWRRVLLQQPTHNSLGTWGNDLP